MVTEFDAAIVGAGPAGAWAAYRLALGGARVALIDGSHPREKACGGGLSARALEVLEPIADRLPAAVHAGGARFAAAGRAADVPLRDRPSRLPALAIVSRREFDAALLRAAQDSGAVHVPRRVVGFTRVPAGWSIETDTNRVQASWLIGADGANSFVRRRVGRPFGRKDLSIASGYYVDGQTDTRIDIEFTDSPPGYLWAFPRPDHLAVGVCGEAEETSSAELLDASRRWIRAHTRTNTMSLRRYSWPIPTLSDRTLVSEAPSGDRWLLTGDAAGLVDPITREGIFFALQSGGFAARSLLSADAAAAYAGFVRSHIYPEMARATRMKRAFFGPAFSTLLVNALQRSDRIAVIMADLVAGRQTYRGLRRRLLMTGEIRIALAYLRSAVADR